MGTSSESWLQITHMSAYAVQLKPNTVKKWVSPAIAIIHVLNGVLEVHAEAGLITAEPNETVLCRAGMAYQFVPRAKEDVAADPVVFHCAEIMFYLNGSIDPDELLVIPDKIEPAQSVGIAALLQELIDNARFSGSHTLDLLARKAELANALLRHLFRSSELCKDGPNLLTGPTLMQRITAYCREQLAAGVTVDAMVRQAHLSRSAFYDYSKKETGLPPAELLKKIRLEKSLEMMRLTGRTIAEISKSVGFANPYHFSREFKRRYGVAPSEYRKTMLVADTTPAELVKADALFNGMDYESAAQQYAAIMEKHRGQELGQEACYRRGLSLYLAGAPENAFEVWREIKGTRFESRADLRRCRYLFDRSKHKDVLELLERLCKNPLLAVRTEALHLWSGFVNELVRRKDAVPVWDYLDVKKRLFVRESETDRAAANAFLATGRYPEAAEHFSSHNPIRSMIALRESGMPEEVLRRFPTTEHREQLARTLFVMGRYEELLERYPDCAEHCVNALVRLGRAQEALAQYPQACGHALIVTGNYQGVLKRFPEATLECTEALFQQGKYEEALQRCADETWLKCHLLMRLGKIEEVFAADPSDEFMRHAAAKCILGLEHLACGRTAEGLRQLDALPNMTAKNFFWTYHASSTPQLVVPFAHAISGETGRVERDFKVMAEQLRYCRFQDLWHEARYVLGELDEEGFLAQPHGDGVQERLVFIKALRADLHGDRSVAKKLYARYLEQPKYYLVDVVKMYFARWRSGQKQLRQPL